LSVALDYVATRQQQEGLTMTARFQNPVDTRFGWGSLQDLAAITEQQRVALVTFPEARGLGLVDRLQSLLGERLTPTSPICAALTSTSGSTPLVVTWSSPWAAAAPSIPPRR
jgi:hypothetical protein